MDDDDGAAWAHQQELEHQQLIEIESENHEHSNIDTRRIWNRQDR